jgi:hypothetical protein
MDVVQHGEEAYAIGEGAILVTPESGVEAEVAVEPNLASRGWRGW